LCCGSAGTYNILQPQLAGRLRDRKISNVEAVKPDVIAAGNIGCLVQIEQGLRERGNVVPVLHTIALVDWATGGPRPDAMRSH
jgi:glycolate oxidase iron-sulfur subunit